MFSTTHFYRILLIFSLLYSPGCSYLYSDQKNALVCLDKAQKLARKEKYKKAINQTEKSLEYYNGNTTAQSQLISLYLKTGNYVKAAVAAETYGVRDRDTLKGPERCYHIGLTYIYAANKQKGTVKDGLLQKAKGFIQKSMGLDSMRYVPSYLLQSELNEAMGLAHVLQATYTHVPSDTAKYKRVHWEITRTQLERGLQCYAKAIKYNPENAIAKANLETIVNALQISMPDVSPYPPAQPIVGKWPERKRHAKQDSVTFNGKIIPLKMLPPHYKMMLDTFSHFEEIVFVLDNSGSMLRPLTSDGTKSRMAEMVLCASFLIQNLPDTISIGAINVGGNCGDRPEILRKAGVKRSILLNQVQALFPRGVTPLHASLKQAPDLFSEGYRPSKKRRAICLLSDGVNTCQDPDNICSISSHMYEVGIQTNVVSFLLEEDSENAYAYAAYQCITESSGGILLALNEKATFTAKKVEHPFMDCAILLPKISPDFCVPSRKLFRIDQAKLEKVFEKPLHNINLEVGFKNETVTETAKQ